MAEEIQGNLYCASFQPLRGAAPCLILIRRMQQLVI